MQIPTRRSTASANAKLKDVTRSYLNQSNSAFFRNALTELRQKSPDEGQVFIGFIGSRDLPGVTLRRAQAILRWDIRPSLWSHAFIFTSASEGRAGRSDNPFVYHVPFHTRSDQFPEPQKNAVIRSQLDIFEDESRDANVALVSVSLGADDVAKITRRCKDPNLDRIRYNFWDTLAVWQSYFWSFGLRPNPLRDGCPIPSASFIEYCFEALAIDITPGASERNSAPEHLWNAAKFWYEAYAEKKYLITGRYVLRDMGCSVLSTDEPPKKRRAAARKSPR